jgi:hypothetical protein
VRGDERFNSPMRRVKNRAFSTFSRRAAEAARQQERYCQKQKGKSLFL